MNLHDDRDVFEELVIASADSLGLPQAYVEKDYWVTRVLLSLSRSKYRDDFVFKGGTSLSKAYDLIHRFSEDVDLAAISKNWGSARTKRRIKAVGEAITGGLTYLVNHENEAKRGRFRKTYYQYPMLSEDADLNHASSEILLEVNAMAVPEPHSPADLRSLIADFLVDTDRQDLIQSYGLESFSLNVLDVERTLAEKVIALVRACREDETGDCLKRKIRHVYDVCMITRHGQYSSYIKSDKFPPLLKEVCDSDKLVFEDAAKWVDPPLHEARLFADPSGTWGKVCDEFEGPFSQMVYNQEIPSSREIIELLETLESILRRV